MNVTDFASAERYLSAGKSKTDRPLQNNTRLIRRGEDEIAVRLHETDVVTYHRNGNVTLNSGGWRTVTTKQRINEYSPVGVYSLKSVWYVMDRKNWTQLTEFYDGVVVNKDAELVSEARTTDRSAETKIKNRIKTYVSGYMKKLTAGMPVPSGGDCWDCLFKDKNNKTMGDLKGSAYHLNLHMKDRYYVPSLLINALTEKRYPYPALIAGVNGDTMGGNRAFTYECSRALSQYLKRRLLPEASGSKPV